MSKERQMQDFEFELRKARYIADYSWRGLGGGERSRENSQE